MLVAIPTGRFVQCSGGQATSKFLRERLATRYAHYQALAGNRRLSSTDIEPNEVNVGPRLTVPRLVHLFSWEGAFHAEQVRAGDSSEGCSSGAEARDGLSERVGGDHSGVQAVGDEPRDAEQWDPPQAGRRWTARWDLLRCRRQDPDTEAPAPPNLSKPSKPSKRQRLSSAGERPAQPPLTASVCKFIAARRDRFGVASICRALSEHGVPISAHTFCAWAGHCYRRVQCAHFGAHEWRCPLIR